MPLRCDIFCTAIDNYGDIGVCWRLARQLAGEHGIAVTLWLDDLQAMAHMRAQIDPERHVQPLTVTGGNVITLRRWRPNAADAAEAMPGTTAAAIRPGELVIEGFGCRLPDAFLQAMAARPTPPCWINLEYLSAENWIDGCHGLTSQHPRTGLIQRFWFPGFTPASGGLLRETGLLAARDYFQQDPAAQAAFWRRLSLQDAPEHDRRISLFTYENPGISGLLQTLADDDATTLLLVPAGRALADVERWTGTAGLRPGARLRRGHLDISVLHFLNHGDYDHLLWACELNAVRGEDSFVRAQWAGKPLLWHIYPQDERAHEIKLNAWLTQVQCRVPAMPACWAEASLGWNQASGTRADWPALLRALPAIMTGARDWCRHQARLPDLASSMLSLCIPD